MPTWFLGVAHRPLELFCDSLVEIYPPEAAERAEWSPEKGLSHKDVPPVWRGWAAVTPNKDWRARLRTWGEAATGTHAYRVQLHHAGKNYLFPEEEWGQPGTELPLIGEGWLVKIVQMVGDPKYEGLRLVVRNAVMDNNKWQPTLLCDMEVDHGAGD